SKINRNIMSVYSLASAPTGIEYVEDGFGNIVKKTVGNMLDHAKLGYRDTEQFINFLPFLYNENKEIANSINEIFKVNDINSAGAEYPATEYMEKWLRDLSEGRFSKSLYGYKRKEKDILPELYDYFIYNSIGGDEIFKKLLDSNLLESIRLRSDEDYEMFRNALLEYSNGSQALKEAVAAHGTIAVVGAERMNPMGDIQTQNRPLIFQRLGYKNINITSLDKEDISYLKTKGIRLGTLMESSTTEDYIKTVAKNRDMFVEGLTVNFKTMNDETIAENFLNYRTGVHERAISMKNRLPELKNKSIEEVVDLIESKLDYMETRTNTFLQETAISPALSKIIERKVYHEYDVSDINIDKPMDWIGRKIEAGQTLGEYEHTNKRAIYTKKRGGVIRGFEKGKFIIEETDAAISELKANLGISEKGVFHVWDMKSDLDFNIMQDIWDDVAGESTAVIGNYELKKHMSANFAFSDLYMIGVEALESNDEEIINEYKNQLATLAKGGVGKVEAFTRFEGTPQEFKTFFYDLNTSSDENVFKKYRAIIDYYKGKDGEFYDNVKSKIRHIDTHSDEYVLPFSLMNMNESYSSVSDDLADISEQIGKRGGKVTLRDFEYFGKKRHTKNAEKYFGGYGRNGFVYKADTFTEYFKEQINKNKSYGEAVEDLNRIKMATMLQRDLEVTQEILDSVVKVDLRELQLHTANLEIEDLSKTLWEKYKDKKVIQVQLEHNDLFNPLIKGQRTDKVFIPILHNEIVDGTFVPSEYQKHISRLLDNLQRATMGDPAHNNKNMLLGEANKNFEEMVKQVGFEFNNKDGIFQRRVLSGRLDYSGHQLIGQIFSLNEDREVNNKYIRGIGNLTTKVNIDGKEVDAMIDVIYQSEKALKEIGGDTLFEDIGYQLANSIEDKKFDGNERFIKYLESKKLIDDGQNLINGATYEDIGKEFLRTEGLQGGIKRYPVFSADSSAMAQIRLLDSVKNSTATHMFGYTAMKLNADTDADIDMINLFLKKGENGKVQYYEKGTKIRDDFESMLKGEAVLNEEVFIQKSIDEYKGIKSDFNNSINAEELEIKAEEQGAINGNFNNALYKRSMGKIRRDKEAIGFISNANLYANQVGMSIWTGEEDHKHLKNLLEFNKLTEQKLISAKFSENGNTVLQVGSAKRYYKASTLMANGELDAGINMLAESISKESSDLIDYSSYGFSLDNLDILKNKNYNEIIDKMIEDGVEFNETDEKLLRGVGAYHHLFSNEEARLAYNSEGFRQNAILNRNMARDTINLINSDFNSSTQIAKEKMKILNGDIEVSPQSRSTTRITSLNDNMYIDEIGNIQQVKYANALNSRKAFYVLQDQDGIRRTFTSNHNEIFDYTSIIIDEELKDKLGALSINKNSLTDDELAFISSKEFGEQYRQGRYMAKRVIDDLGVEDIDVKNNVLNSINDKIVEQGKHAKVYNEEQAQIMYDNIVEKAKEISQKDFPENYNSSMQDIMSGDYDDYMHTQGYANIR
ncbi:MAG: hypothetical protein ACRDBY_00590, partial [Cetobacterium sp.]